MEISFRKANKNDLPFLENLRIEAFKPIFTRESEWEVYLAQKNEGRVSNESKSTTKQHLFR